MIKFFGLRRKKKVKAQLTAAIFVAQLNNVITDGFIEIKPRIFGFFQNVPNFEQL